MGAKMPARGTRAAVLLAALAAVAMVAVACGGDDSGGSSKGAVATTAPATGGTVGGFPAERCDANRKAGKILFLTSFDYAAAASITDVVAAKEKGYFDAVCL